MAKKTISFPPVLLKAGLPRSYACGIMPVFDMSVSDAEYKRESGQMISGTRGLMGG